jgi:hypothetical protein
MKKLDEIRRICQEAVDEYNNLTEEDCEGIDREEFRAEMAEEVLEILDGKAE